MSEQAKRRHWMDELTERVRHVFQAGWTEPLAPAAPPRPLLLGPVPPGRVQAPRDLAPFIDHTLLKPDATTSEVLAVCDEARQHGFATVCVNSAHVRTAARALEGTATVAIAVVGFPLGAALPSAKAYEAREAIRLGAREIDMVVNLGALKARDFARVYEDVAAVVQAARGVPVKVILETAQLGLEEKVVAAGLAKAAGAAFVKTSTGFGAGGATVEDVALLRKVVGEGMGVKASGGIRTYADALKMLAAGANRLGCSASVAIVTGATGGTGGY